MTTDTTDTFEAQLLAARRGTDEAQATLLDSFRAYLRKIAVETLGNQRVGQLSASDIVQSAIIDAHRGFGECRAQTRAAFKAWLRQILVNEIMNRHRYLQSQKRDVRRERSLESGGDFDGEDKSPSSHAMLAEDRRRLELAMSQLTDDEQELITMRQRDQLSFVEIGKRTGRNADAVRMSWNRAIKTLAKVLKQGISPDGTPVSDPPPIA